LNFRLASSAARCLPSFLVSAFGRPLARAADPPSRSVFGTQPPNLPAVVSPASSPTDLRLAPPINHPAVPSNSASGSHRLPHLCARPSGRPSACASDRPSRSAFQNSTSDPHRWLRLRLDFPADPRLSPAIDLPGRAFELSLPILTGCRISGSALRSTLGFRLGSAFLLRLRTQPPTNCVVIS
jgi:hypothetical protein